MDFKYARFVAYASIVAEEHLRTALAGRKLAPSLDVLKEAARIGVRKARERIFPGLARDPFKANPLDDVVLGLRYHYEGDPENFGSNVSSGMSSELNALPRTQLPGSAESYRGASDTQQRRLSGTQPLPSDTQRRALAELQHRGLDDSQQRSPSDTQQKVLAGATNQPGETQQQSLSDTQQRRMLYPFSPKGGQGK